MAKCKITVLKKIVNRELLVAYATEEYYRQSQNGCNRFNVGQEFVVGWDEVPQGFCPWAWADIQRDVVAMLLGENVHWVNTPGVIISCCTDGFRPVIFKIERVED